MLLDGSASFDPDGDPLNYTWKQVFGPDVSRNLRDLGGGFLTFDAPGSVSTEILN